MVPQEYGSVPSRGLCADAYPACFHPYGVHRGRQLTKELYFLVKYLLFIMWVYAVFVCAHTTLSVYSHVQRSEVGELVLFH